MNMPEVNQPQIITAEFVKLTVFNDYNDPNDKDVFTFSSSYRAEVIDGETYLPTASYLSISTQQKDLEVTNSSTTISLSGIDSENIFLVLGTKLKGSIVEIKRGFYNSNYQLGNVYQRYTGLVTNYSITEDFVTEPDISDITFTASIVCSSYKDVLGNRIAGRITNRNSWQRFNSIDSSMNNVSAISDQIFDFGMPPKNNRGGGSGGGSGGGGVREFNPGNNENLR